MSDSVIDSELIVLHNTWGSPGPETSQPLGGFTGTSHHNVATAAFPLGTIVRVYCDGTVGQPGFSELAYLQLGTIDATNSIHAKHICVPDSATYWYKVTNDVSSANASAGEGHAAIAISDMTTAYYGWFWVGGVCPEQYITALGGDYGTAGSVAVGAFTVVALASSGTTYGDFGLGVLTATSESFGSALAADD